MIFGCAYPTLRWGLHTLVHSVHCSALTNINSIAGNINLKSIPIQQIIIHAKNCVTMSHKISSICMKVMIVSCFLLLFQPLMAQYNFSGLDGSLERNKKLLGNNFVAMVWKDTMIHKKEIGEFNS